jgi:hypothetical protein
MYYKRFYSDLKKLTQIVILANDGRVNLSRFSGRKAIPCGKIDVYLRMPVAATTPISLAIALDRQHTNALKWHTRMVFIHWLTIGVLSISHWRNDTDIESPISSFGQRQLFQLSIKLSAMLGLNFIPVIKASVLISPTRQRPNQPTTYAKHPQATKARNTYTARTLCHLLAIYLLVISACKNPSRYDFNRHTPVLSLAQRPGSSDDARKGGRNGPS